MTYKTATGRFQRLTMSNNRGSQPARGACHSPRGSSFSSRETPHSSSAPAHPSSASSQSLWVSSYTLRGSSRPDRPPHTFTRIARRAHVPSLLTLNPTSRIQIILNIAETNQPLRNRNYAHAQRGLQILQHDMLPRHLNPAQASTLTGQIEPTNYTPSAADAIRFCYYMQSQGFDTYVSIRDDELWCYITNPDFPLQWNEDRDRLYWGQNIITNQVHFRARDTVGEDQETGALANTAWDLYLQHLAIQRRDQVRRQEDAVQRSEEQDREWRELVNAVWAEHNVANFILEFEDGNMEL